MNEDRTTGSDSITEAGAPRDGAAMPPTTAGLSDERFDERGVPQGRTIDATWEIGPRDVHRRIFHSGEKRAIREGDSLPLLLDCRTDQEVQLASIPGALHVPMHDVNARLQELRAHEERPVIVFCHHGQRSMQVAVTLRELGFADVRSMHGGIDLWSQSVDPGVPRY